MVFAVWFPEGPLQNLPRPAYPLVNVGIIPAQADDSFELL
jgi:hypothetical protein